MCLRNTNTPGGYNIQNGYEYKGHGQDHNVIDLSVTSKNAHVKYECLISNGSKVMTKF